MHHLEPHQTDCRPTMPRLVSALLSPILLLAACAGGDGGGQGTLILGGAGPESFLQAMELALEDHIARGGVVIPEALLAHEVSSLAGPALEVAEELVSTPGLEAVVGHANSVASVATSQIYNRAEVLQIAPTSTAPIFAEAGPFSFRMVPSDASQGRFLAQMLMDEFDPDAAIALLYVNDDYGRGLRRSVLDQLPPEGPTVKLDLPHTEGELTLVDTEHTLHALAGEEVEGILWLGRVPALDLLLPGIRRELGQVLVIGGDALSRADLKTELDSSWEGVRYTEFLDMDGSSELQDFAQRFLDRTGGRAGAPEALSYDATMLILAALEAGARTGEEIRQYLVELGRERPPHQGVTGPIAFTQNREVTRGFVVREIRRFSGAHP
jgi:branched-chain amino acid transport system substrate-binding protein